MYQFTRIQNFLVDLIIVMILIMLMVSSFYLLKGFFKNYRKYNNMPPKQEEIMPAVPDELHRLHEKLFEERKEYVEKQRENL